MNGISSRKKIWLLTVGEPLPIDGKNQRLLRTGILSEHLSEQGHDVTWWTSSFDHNRKQQRSKEDKKISLPKGYDISLLYSKGYESNVSLARMRNHRSVASSFRRLAKLEDKPDVILCSWPLIELAAEAVQYGQNNDVPVVLDFRDMWPDAIVDLFPRPLQPMTRWALRKSYHQGRFAVANATAISGITDKIVDWGLSIAERERNASDRAFYMGYRSAAVEEPDVREADAYWDSLGVTGREFEFTACFFGCIGRHFEWETLFEAARRMHRKGRRCKIVVCGEGPHLSKWQKKTANLPNVVLPGWVDAAKIRSLMARSTIGLAPYLSSWDFTMSLPNKPIEYFSGGLPVVSSLQGELASLLARQECGVTYANDSIDGLVRVLCDCYDRPEWCASMGQNALGLYQKQFVAETIYDQMGKYLVEIAGRQGRQAAA